jgi:sec-independent protein translocase protein TatA
MPNLGPMELIAIIAVALLVFGAGRIADLGKGLGQGIKNFKQGLREAGDDEEAAAAKKDVKVKTAKEKEAAEEV